MAVIKVPRPPQSAVDKDRPMSALLRSQIEHLQEAEFRLPAKHQTNIYINAVKTEGEAADYIRRVTEAVHKAHGLKIVGQKRKPGISLAAAARATQKRKSMRNARTKGRRVTTERKRNK